MNQSITLSTGRRCLLVNPDLPFLQHYHVLSCRAAERLPTHEEVEEIVLVATRKARELGKKYFNDEECFSLIFNGMRTRRQPWVHVHILPTRNLAAKRVAFVAFYLKHLLRRWPVRYFSLAKPGGVRES